MEARLDRTALLTAIQSRSDWKNQRQIASELGVSQATVQRVMQAARIALPRRPGRAYSLNQASPLPGDDPGFDSRPEWSQADFNRLWASRTRKLMEWLKAGKPARAFRLHEQMTGREISVAIGWVPWPEDWNPPYGARDSDPMAAHAPDCQCGPCSSCRPAEYHARLAHAA
jgi:DNA-binding transcriptional MocR family regulator